MRLYYVCYCTSKNVLLIHQGVARNGNHRITKCSTQYVSIFFLFEFIVSYLKGSHRDSIQNELFVQMVTSVQGGAGTYVKC